MMVQKQVWHSRTRYIIVVEGIATVQVELYDEPQGPDKVTAFICSLWVNEDERRYGHAGRILDRAEEIAAKEGHKRVHLEWCSLDSPQWVLEWYLRRGYEEREFGPNSSLLVKELNQIK
ncbi:N-acetyltransferase [Muribaculaceae bacterium Isolate-007 (NCI)]|uniref:GNAT family N-acetyltransferase n=1 Tax=Duncaniella sp. C9 TaxID=2530392 RepID=UPI000F46DAF3|nr:GNAT family N-acetyltransferase [Duncaniella sp. C9]QCD39694.1 N-acetyltransferase [Duncaniella sp. C9]ROT10418.1 N-acetyltransferase [Muribaculaceae bacterium Isolate-100 (HZI)]RXE66282.1 N-acetyltransferase [Muribaculaceae bacterium Isolate-007 (NCI)]